MLLHGTMNIEADVLSIGGVSTQTLVKTYQTPLYVYDEALIQKNCRDYLTHFDCLNGKNRIAYASKAFLPLYMCRLIQQEGLYLDVVSEGELYTASRANFPMARVLFHGNNKTPSEIKMGIELGVGVFVVDNEYELKQLQAYCLKKQCTQQIYLRITPGIEAHTHQYIKTGQIDSKFGFTVENGDLWACLKRFNEYTQLQLVGLHAHIGSQIFDVEPFYEEVTVMMKLLKAIKDQFSIELSVVNLGGGMGVYYTDADTPKSIETFCQCLLEHAKKTCEALEMALPILMLEPGRSIVANAGSTLYTVGSMKDILNVRTYVSVDGGMTDNIRPSLYQARYECAVANRMVGKSSSLVTIAGKCCESGDILITDADVSQIEPFDTLVIASTGAYGYSMASTYNKILKAAVVVVRDGHHELIIRRQTFEELLMQEI